jgi:hypothetical protein
VVLREFAPLDPGASIAFVLRSQAQVRYAAAELARAWPAADPAAQPKLGRLFGSLKREQWLFVQGGIYGGLFPWSLRADRVTVVLGKLEELGDSREAARLRALALSVMPEHPIPEIPADGGGVCVGYLADYDWVWTRDYVGPDRRRSPTGFLNRYVFLGKRRTVPEEIRHSQAHVDRLSRKAVACIAAYVALSACDTVLTWDFVTAGAVAELNPLLRPLLEWNWLAFAAAKNALSLLAIFVVVRFERFPYGMAVLYLNVLLYLGLNAYWAALLLGF